MTPTRDPDPAAADPAADPASDPGAEPDDDAAPDEWPDADDTGLVPFAAESEAEDYERAAWAAAEGDLKEVLRCYHASMPVPPLERERWALLLLAAGAVDAGTELLPRIADPGLRAQVAELVAESRAEDEPDGGPADDELFSVDLRPLEAGRPDDALVERFLDFFGGRRDLYARQWFDEKRGRGGYRPVREPLTAAVVRSHLEAMWKPRSWARLQSCAEGRAWSQAMWLRRSCSSFTVGRRRTLPRIARSPVCWRGSRPSRGISSWTRADGWPRERSPALVGTGSRSWLLR